MFKMPKNIFTAILITLPLMSDAQIFLMEKYAEQVKAFNGNEIEFENGKTVNLNAGITDKLIVITRHGEKADKSKDTDLSDNGHARAQRLSRILKKAPVFDMVFSSDFTRTINTIRPYCLSKNINWQLYDPRNPDELIEKLNGHKLTLVSGHSNTIPVLINKLCGTGLAEFNENDYSNLIVIKVPATGTREIYFFKY